MLTLIERSILYALENNALLFISGHTGSGKSTRMYNHFTFILELPKILLAAGYASNKPIIITQSQKTSVVSLAQKVSQELGSRLGYPIGYSVPWKEVGIRSSSSTTNTTSIWFKTDSMLLKEILCDPLLSSYSVIIIDDVHERSSNIDILLSLLKRILLSGQRPDLKVILCSATLQIEDIIKFFGFSILSKVINIETKIFPIAISYSFSTPTLNQLHDAIIKAIFHFNQKLFLTHADNNGSILVFLPGRSDIYSIISILENDKQLLDKYSEYPK